MYAPSASTYEPALASAHDVEPAALTYEPDVQLSHAFCPLPLMVPIGHAVSPEAPAVAT